jgi:nitroreductase
MKPVANQTLLNQLNWRYATKKFDSSKKIPAEDWKTLEQSLILAPSSYGLQPWHFVVITSPKVKEQLKGAAYGQHQLVDASHVVVFAVNKRVDAAYVEKFIAATAAAHHVPVEKLAHYKKIIQGTIAGQDSAATEAWNARQVYIALGQLLTSAALLGIDACPMEGIQPAKFDEILGLADKGFGTLMIAALGYRSPEDPYAVAPKVRFTADELVTRLD